MSLFRLGLVSLATMTISVASGTVGWGQTPNPPIVSHQPSSWQQYAGFSVTLYVSAESDIPLSYQWFKDTVAIEGATQSYLGLQGLTPEDGGNYWVEVTNDNGTTRSKTVTGAVLTQDTIGMASQPRGRVVDLGEEVRLQADAYGARPFTYAWKHNGQLLTGSGTTSSTLRVDIDDESQLGTYVAVISNAVGTVESEPATISRAPARIPYFSNHPVAMVVLRPGETFAGIKATIAANRPGTFELLKDGVPVPGEFPETPSNLTSVNKLGFTPIQPDHAGSYQFRYTNEAGTVLSGACEIVVTESTLPPLITGASESQSAEGASNVSISVQTLAGTSPQFQWFHDDKPIPGALGPELRFHNFSVNDIGNYTVRVTTAWQSMMSAPFRMDIAESGRAPYFNEEFRDPLLTNLANVDLRAGGEKPIRYQWYLDGEPISRNDLLRDEIGSPNDLQLEATNRWGSTFAPPAQGFTPDPLPVVILYQPADLSLAAGTRRAEFRVTVASHNTANLTYEWFKDGELIPGNYSERLIIEPLNKSDEGDYTVKLTNPAGTVFSESASLEIRPVSGLPTFTQHPVGQEITLGDPFTLNGSSTLDSGELAYQWYFNFQPLPGATSATLTIDEITRSTEGYYQLLASGPAGSIRSKYALISMEPTNSLRITSQPQDASVSVGDSAEFTVTVESDSPVTYRWHDRLMRTVGGDAPTLLIPHAGAQEAGNYRVLVSNETESFYSDHAELIVERDADFYFSEQPTSITIAEGQPFTLRAKAETTVPRLSYRWYRDGVILGSQTGATLTIESATTNDAGAYHVEASAFGSPIVSRVAFVTVLPGDSTHQFSQRVIGRSYVPGEDIVIFNEVAYTGTISRLTWSTLLPEGTSLITSEFPGARQPDDGGVGLAEWDWSTVQPSPFSFTYTISTPPLGDAPLSLTTMVAVEREDEASQDLLVPPDPLVVPVRRSLHSADSDGNRRLNLSELLAVIGLYNAREGSQRTGRYDFDGISRYLAAPGLGRLPRRVHSADINGNGMIDLSELLRVIEIYNAREGTTRTGAYEEDQTTADGFSVSTGG